MQTYYTLEEVAKMLKVSKLTLYRAIKARKISYKKIGPAYRFTQNDIDKFLEGQ